jgi:hypothetical protein
MDCDDGRQKLGSSILDLPAPPRQASATICQPIFSEALPDNKEGYDREHMTQNYLLTIPPNKPTDEQELKLWKAARSLNDLLISKSIE